VNTTDLLNKMPAPVIDYAECLRDSPKFRQQLHLNDVSLDDLESKLEKLLKVTNVMIEGGRTYVSQQAQFQAALWEMSSYFASDQETDTTATLNKLIHSLQELTKFQNILVDQASRSITKNLTSFLREDMKQMKETKGYFNKISNDLDSALSKNAAVSKSRPSELEDASNLLTATRSCFRYTGMDYVYQISMLQARKRHVVLDVLANYMSAYRTFFHQGSDLFSDLDPFLKQLMVNVQGMQESSTVLEKHLEKRHTYVTQSDLATLSADIPGKSKPVRIEGYLFKRGQNAFRTWNRRWFYLSNNKLCYSKRNGDDVTVIEEDLRICLVRPLNDIDRRFCFEVISPVKSHVLQADSEEMYGVWLTSLQQGISSALHEAIMDDEDTSTVSAQWEDSDTEEAQDIKNKSMVASSSRNAKQILDIPGNELCADCRAPDPQWASINFGVTLCIECGGIHRSLGVHITKVRSITLDMWEPEILKVMAELGNNIVNQVLEGQLGERRRPGPDASRPDREVWITDKYKEKKFVNKEVFQSREASEAEAWTVKRLRRRARGGTKGKKNSKDSAKETDEEQGKEALDDEEKDVDTTQDQEPEESSLLESVMRASTLAGSGSPPDWEKSDVSPVKIMPAKLKVLNAEVCVFGGSLGKHHVASVQLDSDQESTDGEEEDVEVQPCDQLSLLTPDFLLYRAARAHNLPVMCEALALGADAQWKNTADERRSAIHQSILSGSVMACEFLILNGAGTGSVDALGDTALHLAAKLGNTGQVCLLLKHRADHHRVNNEGKEPLDIAVTNSDADIVTLLRLAALNEEIRAADMTGDDDTFNDVVQEFSQMVYTHPERLQKKK